MGGGDHRWSCNRGDRLELGMGLSWDCETLGINKHKDKITVISLYDPEAGISRVLRFVDLNEDCDVVYCDNYMETVAELVEYLDNAEILIGFNLVNFDIPFVQIQFNIPNEKVQQWVLKTRDVLEICRRGCARTFNLNSALALNKVGDGGKTGSGMEAVHQAQRGDWADLEAYCLSDAVLTYELTMLPVIMCCESYNWRKRNNERTHDPSRVLKIHTDKAPMLSFSYGPVPGYEDASTSKRVCT
jgi:DNA polymerase elongation subunit (family B)